MSLAQLVQQGFSRYGAIGGLQRVARVTRHQFRDLPRVREIHIWYVLALEQARPYLPMPAGFECRRGTAEDLPQLQRLGMVGFLAAQQRLAAGAELWLIYRAAQAVCSFWIFHHCTPARAARGGWLRLPAGVVCLEDAITIAEYRGRGLSSAGWSQVMDTLAQSGMRMVLTKVVEDNLPSRRAMEKVGFRTIAHMSFERVWLLPRVRLVPEDACMLPAFLFQQLNR